MVRMVERREKAHAERDFEKERKVAEKDVKQRKKEKERTREKESQLRSGENI